MCRRVMAVGCPAGVLLAEGGGGAGTGVPMPLRLVAAGGKQQLLREGSTRSQRGFPGEPSPSPPCCSPALPLPGLQSCHQLCPHAGTKVSPDRSCPLAGWDPPTPGFWHGMGLQQHSSWGQGPTAAPGHEGHCGGVALQLPPATYMLMGGSHRWWLLSSHCNEREEGVSADQAPPPSPALGLEEAPPGPRLPPLPLTWGSPPRSRGAARSAPARSGWRSASPSPPSAPWEGGRG